MARVIVKYHKLRSLSIMLKEMSSSCNCTKSLRWSSISEWNLKNLLRDIFKRLRRLIEPRVLKTIAGLPTEGTEEKKLEARFKSSKFAIWNMSSGSCSRLFAAKSSCFRFLH